MDQAELEKQRRYFWDSSLSVMLGPKLSTFFGKYASPLQPKVRDVEADPNDKLSLQFEGEEEHTYQMYSTAWFRSLDYLLYRYLTLVLHDTHYSGKIKVPVVVRQKYENYRQLSSIRQNKDHEFILPDYYRKPHAGKTHSGQNEVRFEHFTTNNPVAPAILNVFCHGLFPRSNNNEVRWSPHENARLYTFDDYSNGAIPDFKSEDYIAYELMTGLSLSAEITAILLEMDENIRYIALYYFSKYSLNDLVRLPFPYARASAVRNYFLSINLDWINARYQWSSAPLIGREYELVNNAALKAQPYINSLYYATPYPDNVQTTPVGFFPSDGERVQNALQYIDLCQKDRTLRCFSKLREIPTLTKRFCSKNIFLHDIEFHFLIRMTLL